MSTKPYKDIEKIMKEASEAYDQAFDAAAWEKMELLLDKEKDRKKPFFWLWWLLPLLIVTGIGSVLLFQNTMNQNKQTVVVENPGKPGIDNKVEAESGKDISYTDKVNQQTTRSTRQPFVNGADSVPAGINNQHKEWKDSKTNPGAPPDKTTGVYNRKKRFSHTTKKKVRVNIQTAVAEDNVENTNSVDKKYDDTIDKRAVNADDIVKEETTSTVKENDVKENDVKDSVKELVKTADTVVSSNQVKLNSKNKPSKFYFIATAGLDANGMKILSVGKITARAGIAIGYQFTKNMSVQSGFFAGSKKYVAGKNDYRFKAGSYWTRVDISKIEADCRVYEIPLLIRYDFNLNKKISYFSSLGLSSFFMKKEEYDYYYYRNGVAYEAYGRYNGNQHLFSVLGISAGASKRISDRISFNLSFGIAVPLAGVGEGQVKLYGTNLMAGLKYTPIRKIKK